jgi:hypothetical protein
VPNHKCKASLFSLITFIVMLNVVLIVVHHDTALGQGVPKINVAPSCKAAAAGYAGLTQEFESCVRSEESAREILVKGWNSFSAADRDSCYRLTTTGTPGTYTELLTCLEMRRDARALPTQKEMRKELEEKPRRPRPKKLPDAEPSSVAR